MIIFFRGPKANVPHHMENLASDIQVNFGMVAVGWILMRLCG